MLISKYSLMVETIRLLISLSLTVTFFNLTTFINACSCSSALSPIIGLNKTLLRTILSETILLFCKSEYCTVNSSVVGTSGSVTVPVES